MCSIKSNVLSTGYNRHAKHARAHTNFSNSPLPLPKNKVVGKTVSQTDTLDRNKITNLDINCKIKKLN